jgi:soluble lytic murein transglycosylase-like protein
VTTRPRFNLRPLQTRAGRTLAWRTATLFAPLTVALLVAPTAHLRQAAPSRVPSATEQAAAAHRAQALAPIRTVDFQAIAGVLARRYRVSARATVDLVRTAYHEANRNGLDPLLVLAVMAVESSFNPIAESDAGAVGLMQIVPRFHEDKLAGRESALDPRVNIEVGTRVLRESIRKAGNETAGLQLYNGSPDDPVSAYANKVMGERDRLRQAIKRADATRA